MKWFLIFCSLAIFTVACGSAPPPTQSLSRSKAAIRGAVEVGAPGTPEAALYLKMARDHLERAEFLIREDKNQEALFSLKRAEADAELAIALAKEAAERAEAQEAMEKVKKLQKERE